MGSFASCVADEDLPPSSSSVRPSRRGSHSRVGDEASLRPQPQTRLSARERSTALLVSSLQAEAATAAARGPNAPDVHANARVGIENTPSGKEKQVYKFFCPICFMHFKEIYKSACCGNYVCVPCALSHITQRLSLPTPLHRIPSGPLSSVCCPACNSEHVSFQPVHTSAQPRNYAESPHTKDCLAKVETRRQALQLATTPEGNKVRSPGPSSQISFQRLNKKIDFECVKEDENEVEAENVTEQEQSHSSQQVQVQAFAPPLCLVPRSPSPPLPPSSAPHSPLLPSLPPSLSITVNAKPVSMETAVAMDMDAPILTPSPSHPTVTPLPLLPPLPLPDTPITPADHAEWASMQTAKATHEEAWSSRRPTREAGEELQPPAPLPLLAC